MRIIELRAKNVKRITAVDIVPDSSLVIISGKNEQGKTSVLDSIWMTLGGAAAAKDVPFPIRKGEKEAEAMVDLGKYKVTRTWTEKGSYLKVESPDGARYPSPQALLDDLRGEYTFDLLDFAKAKPGDQKKILMSLTGLQSVLTTIDKEIADIYSERTMVNREWQSAKNVLASMPVPPEDTPEDPLDVKDILRQQSEAQQAHGDLLVMKDQVDAFRKIERNRTDQLNELEDSSTITRIMDAYNNGISQALRVYQVAVEAAAKIKEETCRGLELTRDAAISTKKETAEEIKKELSVAIAKGDELARKLETADMPPSPEYFQQKVDEAEQINEHVRQKVGRRIQENVVAAKQKASDALSFRIKELETDKDQAISRATFPIEHLGFDDNGVTYKGIPFVQCSSAERLRVSLAIAMALNPKIRVLRITDGSLLDSDNMGIISEMLKEKDFQCWCERVGENTGVGILIEDGSVKE